MRLWLRITRYWESLQFGRRWRDTYRNAVPINADDNIFLSVCSGEYKKYTAECFAHVWERIPKNSRDELRAHWRRLQISWDGRNTGLPLRIPVIAVGKQGEMLAALGTIIGTAIRTQPKSRAGQSMDSVQRLFSGTFLYLWTATSDPPDNDDKDEIARAIVHYYLCMKRKADASHYFLPFTSENVVLDAKLEEWGFDVERLNDATDVEATPRNGVPIFPKTSTDDKPSLDDVNELRDDPA